MGLFNKPQVQNQPNQPPVNPLEAKYNAARSNLMVMVLLTLVNFVFSLVEADTYFLFSSSFPQFAIGMGAGFIEAGMPQLNIVCLGIGLLSIALYFLCWLFSKRNHGWMIVAMVLFILDCLLLVAVGLYAEMILDYLCHIWVLYYLISGVVAASKMKNQPAVPTTPVEEPYAPAAYTADGQPVYQAPQTVVINGEPVDMESGEA